MAQSQWTIVSYIVMSLCLAMFGTICLSRWITINKSHGITETFILVMLLMLQLSTVIFMIVFTRVNRNQWRYVPWRLSDTHGIAIIFLVIFLIGTFIYDIFRIIATTECFDVYKHYSELHNEKILNLALLIFEPLIYMSSQLLFLMWCNYGNIQNNPDIKKSYVFIVASGTNLFLWIHSFLFESKKIFPEENLGYNITILDEAIQKHANKCLHGENKMQEAAEDVEVYLSPVQMEFCILATTLLLHTWSNIKHSRINLNKRIDFPDDIGDGGPKEEVDRHPAVAIQNNGEGNGVDDSNDTIGGNDASSQVKCYGLLWIVALMLMTLLLTFECLLYVQTFYSKAILIATSIKTFYDLSLIAVCVYVLRKLRNSGKMKHHGNINTECVIMLISSLGLFINAAFIYISVIPTMSYNDFDPYWADKCDNFNIVHDMSYYDKSTRQFLIINVLGLLRHTFKIIAVSLQVYLIIMLSCFYTGAVQNLLSECLGFILILNIGHWLNDSIVMVKLTNASPVQEHFFGCNNWLVMVHLFFPLSIYFRFHSVLMLSEHVRGTRHQRHDGYEPFGGDESKQPDNSIDQA